MKLKGQLYDESYGSLDYEPKKIIPIRFGLKLNELNM